jgi:OmpA-OmpF porin, OOP family
MESQLPTQLYRSVKIFPILCGIFLCACAPAVNMSLERARADYQQASNDPALKADAAADLLAAEKLLQKAETSWQENEDTEKTNHLSYLASRKIDLAKATANQAASKRAFDEISAKKDDIRLQAREAEIAKLKAKKVPQGILVTLGDVLFDTARASLKAGSLQNIYPLVQYLKAHPETIVKIEGHTDNRGSVSYNNDLSQRRAESVRSFLVNNGITPDRIRAQGMGEDYPVTTNSTAAGRQQNRRVEVTITDSQQPVVPNYPMNSL